MPAVFVDLDRTLFREGSGQVLSKALESSGLAGGGAPVPGRRVTTVRHPREVSVTVGSPIELVASDARAATAELMAAIAALLPDEAGTARAPGPDELAHTIPLDTGRADG